MPIGIPAHSIPERWLSRSRISNLRQGAFLLGKLVLLSDHGKILLCQFPLLGRNGFALFDHGLKKYQDNGNADRDIDQGHSVIKDQNNGDRKRQDNIGNQTCQDSVGKVLPELKQKGQIQQHPQHRK